MSGTVLVTGATGFIGRHLVTSLARSGWQVRAAARRPEAIEANANVTPVALPGLGAPADWGPLLDGASHVVHLAGLAHAGPDTPDARYERINASATGELARAAAGHIERLVFLSSVRAQAGPAADHVLSERDAPAPVDAYGRSKLEAEELLAASGVSWAALRSVLVYGPGVGGNMAALMALARAPVPLPFKGLANRRSMLCVGNLCDAVAFALTRPEADARVLLVADREPVTPSEMIASLRRGLGRKPGLISVPPPVLSSVCAVLGQRGAWRRLAGALEVDTAAIRGLGWEPRVTTPDGLAALMARSGKANQP